MRVSLLLSATAAAAVALPATAVAGPSGRLLIQHTFDAAGQPRFGIGDGSLGPGAVWRRCAPDCGEPIGNGPLLSPGETVAGTTFSATATSGAGETITESSRPWGGPVTGTAPPTVAGALAHGSVLTAAAGTWSGGWAGDTSALGLRMCVSAVPGAPCVFLPTGAWTLNGLYAGWYVGAVEERQPVDAAFPAIALLVPTDRVSTYPVPAAGPTVAYGALSGPLPAVPASTPAPTSKDGDRPLDFTPKVTLRGRAAKIGGRRVVGSISCADLCVATVVFTSGGRRTAKPMTVTGKRAILWPKTFSRKRSLGVRVVFLRSQATASGRVRPA